MRALESERPLTVEEARGGTILLPPFVRVAFPCGAVQTLRRCRARVRTRCSRACSGCRPPGRPSGLRLGPRRSHERALAAYRAAAGRLLARGQYPSLRALAREAGVSVAFVAMQRRLERVARCPRCQLLHGEDRCGRGEEVL